MEKAIVIPADSYAKLVHGQSVIHNHIQQLEKELKDILESNTNDDEKRLKYTQALDKYLNTQHHLRQDIKINIPTSKSTTTATSTNTEIVDDEIQKLPIIKNKKAQDMLDWLQDQT